MTIKLLERLDESLKLRTLTGKSSVKINLQAITISPTGQVQPAVSKRE